MIKGRVSRSVFFLSAILPPIQFILTSLRKLIYNCSSMKILFNVLWQTAFVVNIANAQSSAANQSSAELHDKAWEQIRENNYEEAKSLLLRIPENDTNFILAQRDLGVVLIGQEKFKEAENIFLDLLKIEYDEVNRPQAYLLLAQAYNGQKRYDETHKILEVAMKEFPMNNVMHFIAATTYEEQKDLEKALESYKTSIRMNMQHHDSHMRLGILAANEGYFAEALMSLGACLMLTRDGNRSSSVLAFMEEISNGSLVPESTGSKLSEEGDNYKLVNQMIKGKVALQSKYKAKFTIPTAFAKQFHLLLSSAEIKENNPGFWSQQYYHFYKAVYDKNMLDGMVLYCLQASENATVKAKLKSSKSTIDKFVASAGKLWNDNKYYQFLDFEGEFQKVANIKSDGYSIIGKPDKDNKAVGNWYYYSKDGRLVLKKTFNGNGEQDGLMVRYHERTGKMIEEANYKNDKLDGLYKEYYPSGELKEVQIWRNGVVQDSVLTYFRGGQLSEKILVKDGKKHGLYTEYFENGKIKAVTNYDNGNYTGKFYSYFQNGAVNKDFETVKNTIQGSKKLYYSNGQLRYDLNVNDDIIDGDYIYYYADGQKETVGKMKAGKYVGDLINYYPNGKVSMVGQYGEDGKENGRSDYFDIEGKKYQTFEYKKGTLQKIELFDKDEKLVKTIVRSGNKIQYEKYYPTRHIAIEGELLNDDRNGEWKYYDHYGTIKQVEKYVKGQLTDSIVKYHPNGKIRVIEHYIDGKINGYYSEYDIFGNLEEEGEFAAGEEVNAWFTYYPNGQIESTYAMDKGNRHGVFKDFSVNGKLTSYDIYSFDNLLSTVYLDTNEQEYLKKELYNGPVVLRDNSNSYDRFKAHYNSGKIDGKVTWYHMNGSLFTEGAFVNGLRHGEWKWYDDKGVLTKHVFYHLGDLHGPYKTFHGNGKLKYVGDYSFNEATGEHLYYYDNGKKEVDSYYMEDLKHGKMTTYGYDGMVQQIRYYDQDVLIGYTYLDRNGKEMPLIPITKGEQSFKTYYQNEVVAMEQNRINGMLNGMYKEFYSDGKSQTISNYYYGERHGQLQEFYPNGKIKVDANYSWDLLNGIRTEYYASGKLKAKEVYVLGELHGESQYYKESGELLQTKVYFDGIEVGKK